MPHTTAVREGDKAVRMDSAKPRMYVIPIGPPGAGKGTQAKILAQQCELSYVGSSAALDEQIRLGTEAGLRAAPYKNAGDLVPDDIMCEVILERALQGGVIDGFPRTVNQARELFFHVINDPNTVIVVIGMALSDDIAIERMCGRLVCPTPCCGRVYHEVFSPPSKNAGFCDHCGAVLEKRVDDTVETCRTRLELYHHKTERVLRYFEGQAQCFPNIFVDTVDASLPVDQLTPAFVGIVEAAFALAGG